MGLLSKIFSSTPAVTPDHIETQEQFKELVLRSDRPVIVNIWSPTCAPCKRMVPELMATASKHADRVRVVEIGTTADRALLGRLQVRSTPTTIIFEHGDELHRFSGYRSRGWFSEMIEAEFASEAVSA